MKRLAAVFLLAAAGLSWAAVKAENPARKMRLALAAAVCWAVVLVGFLV